MDLINQGKGNVLKIWNTNDEIILRKIHQYCYHFNEDFYNPSNNFKNKILKMYNLQEKKR